jgi:transketolase
LTKYDIDARVVSMPCWELFRKQPESYRHEVLPPEVNSRLAIEAGSSFGWKEWIGDKGQMISVERFGSSATYKDNFKHYGFTVENVVEKARKTIQIRQL